MGFPTPFKYYQTVIDHFYYEKILKINEKSLKNKLSNEDIQFLKKVENHFISQAENDSALKLLKKLKKDFKIYTIFFKTYFLNLLVIK